MAYLLVLLILNEKIIRELKKEADTLALSLADFEHAEELILSLEEIVNLIS